MSQPASLVENDPFDDTNILDLSVPQSANVTTQEYQPGNAPSVRMAPEISVILV